jgi:hypothetical protein
MKVKTVNLSRKEPIKRFVDLPKLFELLILGRLRLPTLKMLGNSSDPFECAIVTDGRKTKMSRKDLERKAISLIHYLPNKFKWRGRKGYFDFCKKTIESLKKDALERCVFDMELRMSRERIVCSCWYGGSVESDAMWKIYGQTGVAISSTVGCLARSLKGRYSTFFASHNPQEYEISPMLYVENPDDKSMDDFYRSRPWMLKRKAFQHENEVRMSHRLSNLASAESGMDIDVDPQVLIKEIVLSPFNPEWMNFSIACGIAFILEQKKLKIPIRFSGHMNKPKEANALSQMLELDRLRAHLSGPLSHLSGHD